MNDGYNLKRGKWSMPGVPHKDWRCVGTRDLREEGSEYAICEMCETQEIRYVHTMEHDQYPQRLDCGCDCAGHMEGNSARAEKRDKAMRNRASRRQKFPDRKGWKLSKNGNPFISVEGVRCVVFQRRGGYAIGTAYAFSDDMNWGAETYDTERAAKEACFDAVEKMSARRR